MKIAVYDNDNENLSLISSWLKALSDELEIWCYDTPFSFVTGIYDDRNGDFDLMIVRATKETVEMAMDVKNCFPHIFVIFFSEDVKMAEYSFVADPLFFLYYPMDPERLAAAIEKAKKVITDYSGDSISLSIKGKIVKVRFSSIKYIESEGRKILIYSDDGYFETYMTMDDIQLNLPEFFLRCHRSYIVNSRRIKSVESDDIILSTKECVPVSRSHLASIKNAIS